MNRPVKKLICLALIVFLTGCGDIKDKKPVYEEPEVTEAPTEEVDVDLSKYSKTMLYSQLSNITSDPASYIGKTIKMKGMYSYYKDPVTLTEYHMVTVMDATMCCSQGLEFKLIEGTYPTKGEEICVMGTFNIYEENGSFYYELLNAKTM